MRLPPLWITGPLRLVSRLLGLGQNRFGCGSLRPLWRCCGVNSHLVAASGRRLGTRSDRLARDRRRGNRCRAAVPPNHVSRLIAAGRFETSEPLRWQARLRDDPLVLPWGRRYEIDLEQVETGSTTLSVGGGLLLNLYGRLEAHGTASAPPDLRAGDRVEALVKARPPRNFLDGVPLTCAAISPGKRSIWPARYAAANCSNSLAGRNRRFRSGSRAHVEICCRASTTSSLASQSAPSSCGLCCSEIEASLVARLKRLGVIALTHADHDHLDGLHAVLDNFQVGALWVGKDDERPGFRGLLAEARSRGVTVLHQAQGAECNWDGAFAEVLWPPDHGIATKKSNDNSLVLRLSDGRVRFLLTGDVEQHAEQELLADGVPLASDFLKVPHHGSKRSSTDAFLAAVTPRTAVVSVGEANPFGHPAEAVVERYENMGVTVLRTDRDGAITAVTDGQTLSAHTYAAR